MRGWEMGVATTALRLSLPSLTFKWPDRAAPSTARKRTAPCSTVGAPSRAASVAARTSPSSSWTPTAASSRSRSKAEEREGETSRAASLDGARARTWASRSAKRAEMEGRAGMCVSWNGGGERERRGEKERWMEGRLGRVGKLTRRAAFPHLFKVRKLGDRAQQGGQGPAAGRKAADRAQGGFIARQQGGGRGGRGGGRGDGGCGEGGGAPSAAAR